MITAKEVNRISGSNQPSNLLAEEFAKSLEGPIKAAASNGEFCLDALVTHLHDNVVCDTGVYLHLLGYKISSYPALNGNVIMRVEW